MRKVKCYECGKRYDFDVDDFCPKCGAFTQPPRSTRIGVDGAVVRVDGINEKYHSNSFVHTELHKENRDRKGSLLESVGQSLKSSTLQGSRLAGYRLQKKSGDALTSVTGLLKDLLG